MIEEIKTHLRYLSIIIILISSIISENNLLNSLLKPLLKNQYFKLFKISLIILISNYSIELSFSLSILLMTLLNLDLKNDINKLLNKKV